MRARWVILAMIWGVTVAASVRPTVVVGQDDPAAAQYRMALTHKNAGRNREALAAAREAVRLRPDMAAGWFTIGALERQEGRLEESLTAFRRVVQLQPDSARGHAMVGEEHVALGAVVSTIEKRAAPAVRRAEVGEAVRGQPEANTPRGPVGECLGRREELSIDGDGVVDIV